VITDQTQFFALLSANSAWAVVVYVLTAVGLWRVFWKAGLPGWLAIIPLVNLFVLVKVGSLSAWWGLLFIVPLVNVVFAIVLAFRIGRNFGKGGAFSFFLLWIPVLSTVGYLILGFGRARWTGRARA